MNYEACAVNWKWKIITMYNYLTFCQLKHWQDRQWLSNFLQVLTVIISKIYKSSFWHVLFEVGFKVLSGEASWVIRLVLGAIDKSDLLLITLHCCHKYTVIVTIENINIITLKFTILYENENTNICALHYYSVPPQETNSSKKNHIVQYSYFCSCDSFYVIFYSFLIIFVFLSILMAWFC